MECGCSTLKGMTVLAQTKGMCRDCRQIVDARYVARDERVYLERHCPEHGKNAALVAEDLTWYLESLQAPAACTAPHKVLTERSGQCPSSCGPCAFHGQNCHLPVFSITNACDLRCPICFTYNRSDQTYFMPEDEFKRHIDFLLDSVGKVDLINITGGEPTLHPELPKLLEYAKRKEIGRITLNTNGLELAQNAALAKKLADLGVYVILSYDTNAPQTSERIHGRDIVAQKKQALERLAEFDIQTTLLMVLINGTNDHELGDLIDMTLELGFVRSLTIQTMTYTGQGGGGFGPRQHLPVDMVERLIEEASGGRIKRSSFMPLPTAHPLCYGVSYLMQNDKDVYALSELLPKDTIAGYLKDGYLLHPDENFERELKDAIDRVWSEGGAPELLRGIKEMISALYPAGQKLSVHERQRLSEKQIKTIYVHAHMDEDNFEVGRAMRCPDQVPVNAERLISACNYNLFYRMQDERFWVEK